MQSRYVRLGPGEAGGVKLANRHLVNPDLSDDEVYDVRGFSALLTTRFGTPDPAGDADYSYSILDRHTGVRFEAYAAQSGPAYGGSPAECFVDYDNDDYRLKPEVMQALVDFERWIGGKDDAER